MDIISIFIEIILFVEAGLFLFFVMALAVKILERIKEKKKDKYKNIQK